MAEEGLGGEGEGAGCLEGDDLSCHRWPKQESVIVTTGQSLCRSQTVRDAMMKMSVWRKRMLILGDERAKTPLLGLQSHCEESHVCGMVIQMLETRTARRARLCAIM